MQFPKEFPLALAGLALTGVAVTFNLFRAGSFRKEAGVSYPALYADDAEARVDKKKHQFNCAQRGAFNVLETYPQTLVWLAIAGLAHPRVSAGLSVAYSVGAVFFAIGYSTGDPDRRYSSLGGIFRLAQLGSIIGAAAASYELITAALK